MPKLSALPTISAPALADKIVETVASGPTDGEATIQTILALLTSSNVFGATVQSQTNSASAGGTMWWVNLAGVKLMWGVTNAVQGTSSGGANGAVTMPAFLTTVQAAFCTIMGTQTTNDQFVNWGGGYPTTTAGQLNCWSASTTPSSMQIAWLIIGT